MAGVAEIVRLTEDAGRGASGESIQMSFAASFASGSLTVHVCPGRDMKIGFGRFGFSLSQPMMICINVPCRKSGLMEEVKY